MLKAIFPIVLVDVAEHLTPEDKKYFVESREKMFGTKLENVGMIGSFHLAFVTHCRLSQFVSSLIVSPSS